MRRALVSLVSVLTMSCATSSPEASTSTTPQSQEPAAVVHGTCHAEYVADVDATAIGVHIEGAGDYIAAAVGPGWTFDCSGEGRSLLRGQQEGTGRTVGIQRDPPIEGELELSEYLTRFIEEANAQIVANGFVIEMRMGPRTLAPDTVVMALKLSKDGQSGVQFVIMRALRSPIGILRYVAVEWGTDPNQLEPIIEALFAASQAFMRAE